MPAISDQDMNVTLAEETKVGGTWETIFVRLRILFD